MLLVHGGWSSVVEDMMTDIVAVFSYKGGTGKTTIAYNLLERARSEGLSACLVDYDPQRVAASFWDVRQQRAERGDLPEGSAEFEVMLSEFGPGMVRVLENLRESNYDLVVCDLPGTRQLETIRFLSEVDLILAPCGAGPADMVVAEDLVWYMKRASLDAFFVPSLMPSIRRRREMMLKRLGGQGLPVCETGLVARVAHHDAMEVGLGVCEFAPGSAAAAEVDALWRWVAGRLGLKLKRDEHGGGNDVGQNVAQEVG